MAWDTCVNISRNGDTIMNISTAQTTTPKTLNTLRANMMAAREAVAHRQTVNGSFKGYDVMSATDHMSDQLDIYGPQFGWTNETDAASAARDLRKSRTADFVEAGCRGVAGFVAVGVLGEALKLAESTGMLTLTEGWSGFGACALGVTTAFLATRPDKGLAAYQRGVEKGPLASRLERWA
jgi:hypothetical protein